MLYFWLLVVNDLVMQPLYLPENTYLTALNSYSSTCSF